MPTNLLLLGIGVAFLIVLTAGWKQPEYRNDNLRWSGGGARNDTLRIWQGKPFKCIFMSAPDTFLVIVERP